MTMIPPLSKVLDVEELRKSVEVLSISKVLELLLNYDIVAWRLDDLDIYVAQDIETKNWNFVRISHLIGISEPKLALEVKFGIKLYGKQQLRRILYGLLVHQAYQYAISNLLEDAQVEVPVVNNQYKITGRADIVTRDYVIEIKGGVHNEFYKYQLGAYMLALNKSKGFLVYKDAVYPIEMNRILRDCIIGKIYELRQVYQQILKMDLLTIINKYTYILMNNTKYATEDLVRLLIDNGFLEIRWY